MSATIAWATGGDGVLLAHDGGTLVTVRSTKPFPPGAPVAGTLGAGERQWAFQLKVASTRKVDEGAWEVRGRLLSATTELIAAFASAKG
jgi:hypothetical protein